jgi:hypothetical protein
LGLPEEHGGPKKRIWDQIVDFGDKKEKINVLEVFKEAIFLDNMLIDGYKNKGKRVEVDDEVVVMTSPRPSCNDEERRPQNTQKKKGKSMSSWIDYQEFKGLSEGGSRVKDDGYSFL